jgi:hypothetical protein
MLNCQDVSQGLQNGVQPCRLQHIPYIRYTLTRPHVPPAQNRRSKHVKPQILLDKLFIGLQCDGLESTAHTIIVHNVLPNRTVLVMCLYRYLVCMERAAKLHSWKTPFTAHTLCENKLSSSSVLLYRINCFHYTEKHSPSPRKCKLFRSLLCTWTLISRPQSSHTSTFNIILEDDGHSALHTRFPHGEIIITYVPRILKMQHRTSEVLYSVLEMEI